MSQSWKPISSRADLHEFINADLKHRGLSKLPFLYQYRKPIVHYTVMLRKAEFLTNTAKSRIGKIRASICRIRLKRLGSKLGFTISVNTFGPGLYLMHWGSIAISSTARIGRNARVHTCVNLAGDQIIGDNVYFGPGAKLFGNITIGNNVSIGANAVVAVSFPDNVTLMGIPARVIKSKN